MILGTTDPLADILIHHDTKVYRVGNTHDSQGLKWPTVETLAEIILRAMNRLITIESGVTVTSVTVKETVNNSVTVTSADVKR